MPLHIERITELVTWWWFEMRKDFYFDFIKIIYYLFVCMMIKKTALMWDWDGFDLNIKYWLTKQLGYLLKAWVHITDISRILQLNVALEYINYKKYNQLYMYIFKFFFLYTHNRNSWICNRWFY
jgi:hypothetical protein